MIIPNVHSNAAGARRLGRRALFLLGLILGSILPGGTGAHAATLPTIDELTPNSGAVAGGTRVYLRGDNIVVSAETQVLLSETPATDIRFHTTADGVPYLSFLTPPHTAGGVDTVVQNPDGGRVRNAESFYYFDTPDTDFCTLAEGLPLTGTIHTIAPEGFAVGASECTSFGTVRWFSVRPPAEGTLSLATCASAYVPESTLTIFDSCGGEAVACSALSCGTEAKIIDFPVSACQTYYIQVGTLINQTFEFTLRSAFTATGTPAGCGEGEGEGEGEISPCAELVVNGNLEGTGGRWGEFIDPEFIDDASNAYDGTHAIELEAGEEGLSSIVWTYVHIEEGATATLQFARKLDLTAGADSTFQVSLASDVPMDGVIVHEEPLVDSDYELITVALGPFVESGDRLLSFTSFSKDGGGGLAWVDSIGFTLCAGDPDPRCVERIPDGGFEDGLGGWESLGDVAQDALDPFEGASAMRIHQNGSNHSGIQRTFRIHKGRSATLTFARKMQLNSGSPLNFLAAIQYQSGIYNFLVNETTENRPYEVKTFELGPFSYTGALELFFTDVPGVSEYDADVWIDSVSLVECAPIIDDGIGGVGTQSADQNNDFAVDLDELLRVIQIYNSFAYRCAAQGEESEDGFLPGPGVAQACTPHSTDCAPQDWSVSIDELLRAIQFYNSPGGYRLCEGSEDGYCPGAV